MAGKKTAAKRSIESTSEMLTRDAYKFGQRSLREARARLDLEDMVVMSIYDGIDDDSRRYIESMGRNTRPKNLKGCQKAARNWSEKNQLMMTLIGLKRSVLNYGFAVRSKEPLTKKSDRAEFEAWWKKHGPAILKMARTSWTDDLVMDCSVVFWRSKQVKAKGPSQIIPRVFVKAPEQCRYSDVFGQERLFIESNYTFKELKAAGLSDAQARRYAQNEVELLEEEGEHFRVFKMARTGEGFGRPRMEAVFEPLTTEEGLQFADRCWALLSQTVMRVWKLGHEIRNGPYAGQPHHFMTPEESAKMKLAMKNRRGVVDVCVNFDREVEYPHPSLDRFDGKKFEASWRKLAQWAGPIGMLFLGGQNLQPEMQQRLMLAEALEIRAEKKLFLEEIIETVFAPPMEIGVSWGEEIFTDTRQFIELVKALLSQGALSQKSALRAAGFDQLEEQANKAEEFALSQDEKKKGLVLPVYDKDHGKRPGEPSGRPAGTKG